jgi:hypothetical protein
MTHAYVAALLYGIAALLPAVTLFGWWRTAKVLGGLHFETVQLMSLLRGKARSLVVRTLFPLAASAAGVALIWRGGPFVPWGCVWIAAWLSLAARSVQPPMILILTNSGVGPGWLFWKLNFGLFPLRTVALLDPSRMGRLLGALNLVDNLRTRDPDVWKAIVYRLIETVAAVVLDTRASGVVQLEAAILLDPRRVLKALFVTTEDGRSPALEVHGISPANHALRTVTESELIPTLREWTRSADSLPYPPARPAPLGGLVSETYAALPSVVVVTTGGTFDADEVFEQACATRQDLVAVDAGHGGAADGGWKWTFDLNWEFTHDLGLAILVLRKSRRVIVRTRFLREAGSGFAVTARDPVLGRRPTFEELFQPDPVWESVLRWVRLLTERAERLNQRCRYIEQ